ncbi:MAG: dihydrodipicolinate reductase [bacterium]|nr:dihydrodipicolinate reductase [bacterium]
MPHRVVVWGTGNAGKPAIRAVVANRALELIGVLVSDTAKVGRDAGTLAGLPATGVVATNDVDAVLGLRPDAVVYTATGDTRPGDAVDDVLRCLAAGANVVSSAIYLLLHPPSVPDDLRTRVEEACRGGGTSIFVSGIDPGWAVDLLPLVLSGVATRIDELRCREIFDYATYDQPHAVRNLIGFGRPLGETPPMLFPGALDMVWGSMVRVLADGLGVRLDGVEIVVERRPLARTIDTPEMGVFEAGTQGAFRFEVQGVVAGRPRVVCEHVTRIDPTCAPEWPQPAPGQRGSYAVLVTGEPSFEVAVTLHAGGGSAADAGNATAAARLVHAIPAVCAARPGILSTLDLPLVTGRGLL